MSSQSAQRLRFVRDKAILLIQWNHKVHEEWGKERLYFWRLAFSPTYNREAVLLQLQAVLAEHSIRSYVAYELIGDWDLILRIWLPVTSTQEEFENSLRAKLRGDHINLVAESVFAVRSILLHWVWPNASGHPSEPDSEVLERRLSPEAIQRINALDNYSSLPLVELNELKTKRLIAQMESSSGVKFFTVITASSLVQTSGARQELEKRLRGLLIDAEGIIEEPSIYAGSGFGQYLIMGKVPLERFFDITGYVIEKINSTGVQGYFGVRTYTQVSGTEGFLLYEDDLPLDAPAGETTALEGLFDRAESQDLEVKGSAFVDIKAWLHAGKTERNDQILNEGVLKAVVGLLNAGGGTVIVGAIERSKFEQFLDSKLAEYPTSGNYVIVGLKLDYQVAGSTRDWDALELRLRSVLSSRIEPAPHVWVTIRRELFRGQELCVIAVAEPDRGWYYLNDKDRLVFYVRQGNQTVEMTGPDADTYKIVRARG